MCGWHQNPFLISLTFGSSSPWEDSHPIDQVTSSLNQSINQGNMRTSCNPIFYGKGWLLAPVFCLDSSLPRKKDGKSTENRAINAIRQDTAPCSESEIVPYNDQPWPEWRQIWKSLHRASPETAPHNRPKERIWKWERERGVPCHYGFFRTLADITTLHAQTMREECRTQSNRMYMEIRVSSNIPSVKRYFVGFEPR